MSDLPLESVVDLRPPLSVVAAVPGDTLKTAMCNMVGLSPRAVNIKAKLGTEIV